jgi:hypothetical protein
MHEIIHWSITTAAANAPAAAWYLNIFCVRFLRAARGKTAHKLKGKYRSAEG